MKTHFKKLTRGGLQCKGRNKIVYVYPASTIRRCLVYFLKKYIGLMPDSKRCKKLYLSCKKYPTPATWYCDQPYGVNKIKATVKEICKEAGIEGHFTNHSLRATCATRMYDKNVPEQIIKEMTGPRSECIRVYKRTSETLQEAASKVVSGEKCEKKIKIDDESTDEEVSKDDNVLSFSKMIENVNKTKEELRRKMFPKSRLKARRLLNKAKKVTIDLNFNMNVNKKE